MKLTGEFVRAVRRALGDTQEAFGQRFHGNRVFRGGEYFAGPVARRTVNRWERVGCDYFFHMNDWREVIGLAVKRASNPYDRDAVSLLYWQRATLEALGISLPKPKNETLGDRQMSHLGKDLSQK